MASSSLALTFSCSIQRKPTIVSFSSNVISYPNNPKFHLLTSLRSFSLNNGLRHLGISIRQKSGKTEKKGRCRGKVVYASLFGVGAPEALVIGVVALLVFGPKGLAEVARNLGKTLRAFQPTIRELQEVSREFKSTLEREIGLDEIPPSTTNTTVSSPSYVKESPQAMVDPNGTPPTKPPFSSEEHLKATEEQLKPSAAETSTPEEQLQDSSPPTKTPYSTEEYLKFTEEQLKVSAANQQTQTPTLKEQPQAATELAAGTPTSEKLEKER